MAAKALIAICKILLLARDSTSTLKCKSSGKYDQETEERGHYLDRYLASSNTNNQGITISDIIFHIQYHIPTSSN